MSTNKEGESKMISTEDQNHKHIPLCRIIDGNAVFRCQYQRYLYSWGTRVFDMRTLRQVLGLYGESCADVWFTDSLGTSRAAAFDLIMDAIEIGLGKNNMMMADAMSACDVLEDAQF